MISYISSHDDSGKISVKPSSVSSLAIVHDISWICEIFVVALNPEGNLKEPLLFC